VKGGAAPLLIALAIAAAPGAPARAQMADAFGKPLADGALPAGTVTVRVMRADPGAPTTGIEVALIGPDGARLTGKTGADGRARFDKLAAGTEYIAELAASAGGLVRSEPFRIPPSGGLRLMMSPDAAAAGGHGQGPTAPAPPLESAGPAAPAPPSSEFEQPKMPDARQMSGIPRGEPNDRGGQLTVRLLQGSLVQNAPAGTLVHLIAVKSDGSVAKLSKPLGDDGRAVWDRLSVDGSTIYYGRRSACA
jgi:hypothetical protein